MATKKTDILMLPLDRQHSEVLARFLSLVVLNMQLHPEEYGFKAEELKDTLENLDFYIHEKMKWCDKGKECSYWKKKEALEKKQNEMN